MSRTNTTRLQRHMCMEIRRFQRPELKTIIIKTKDYTCLQRQMCMEIRRFQRPELKTIITKTKDYTCLQRQMYKHHGLHKQTQTYKQTTDLTWRGLPAY